MVPHASGEHIHVSGTRRKVRRAPHDQEPQRNPPSTQLLYTLPLSRYGPARLASGVPGRVQRPRVSKTRGGSVSRTRLVAVALVCLFVAAFAGRAGAVSYHSPGYKGNKSFGNVVPAPFPPITLGTGKYPKLLVDESGTAHVVFAQDGGSEAPDTVSYCNLQRGLTACASSGNAPNPQAPEGGDGKGVFSGNFPGGNHDTDGPVPLAIGNQLYVIDRRFPDVFKTPGEKHLRQQRVRVELGRRRRDADRTRPDRRQPDERRRDRLRRTQRALDRHDLSDRDRRDVLPGQRDRPVHDLQGRTGLGRPSLLRQTRARRHPAGRRVRRPERQRVRARVDRSGQTSTTPPPGRPPPSRASSRRSWAARRAFS